MKILQLRFSNLSSLSGEWQIDFSDSAYVTDGIFAITGPTGAGKSTILDAVCLALYGRTPRLDKVTKSGNEIITRQTGECFAEVIFETTHGRFCCHWSQWRARKKPDGILQAPKHEIADAITGQLLDSKSRGVAEQVEILTGMDFQRFTRSMFLAQGGFAAFLLAPPDERAPILEQITGTEIYSQISMKVHQNMAEEHRKLELLKAGLDGIRVLSADEENELRAKLAQNDVDENRHTAQRQILQCALTWLECITVLETDIASLVERQCAFKEQYAVFQPEMERLENAKNALIVDGDYAKVTALRDQQRIDITNLQEIQTKLPDSEISTAKAMQYKKETEEKAVTARSVQKTELEILRKVREIDQTITMNTTQAEDITQAIGKFDEQIDEYNKCIAENNDAFQQYITAIGMIKSYLTENTVDAALIESIGTIGKTFDEYRKIHDKYSSKRDELDGFRINTESVAAKSIECEVTSENARIHLQQTEDEYNNLTQEKRILLKDKDIDEWQRELINVTERGRTLEHVSTTLDTISTNNDRLRVLMDTHELLDSEHNRIVVELGSVRENKMNCEQRVSDIESQVALQNRIRDLESEREHLKDGNPCPLCGATEHPYAECNIPELELSESRLINAKETLISVSDNLAALQVKLAEAEKDLVQNEREIEALRILLSNDDTQLNAILNDAGLTSVSSENLLKIVTDEIEIMSIRRIECDEVIGLSGSLSKKIENARNALDKCRQDLVDAENALHSAAFERDANERECISAANDCTLLCEEIKYIEKDVYESLQVYGIDNITTDNTEEIMKSLEQRKNEWQNNVGAKSDREKEIARLEAEIEKTTALLHKTDADKQAREDAREAVIATLTALKANRCEVYGDKDPDTEEARLEADVMQQEQLLKTAATECERLEKEWNNLQSSMTSLTISTNDRMKEIDIAEATLLLRLNETGFQDEECYKAASLPTEERNRLTTQVESLSREKTEIEALLSNKVHTLEDERLKCLTVQDRETLGQDIETCEANLKVIQQKTGAIKQRLNDDADIRAKQKDQLELMELQRHECAQWDALHALIGSADGKKYRNFAQGLTFEIMTSHANRHLQQLTDRYLLVRDEYVPLELSVIDNYQAGEIRSTKNLSGGESFIVSLALALGLSNMASRNVRVDSLFLDEGFGSLDEDALATALETLASLNEDGKLIGIISHVPAIKERIGTQIQVIPMNGGRSVIKGPGCTSL